MTSSALGDLGASFMFRNQNVLLKSKMQDIMQQISSGTVSARGSAIGGSFRAISGIERSLKMMDAFDLARSEAASLAQSIQSALGAIHEPVEELATDLLSAGTSASSVQLATLAGRAAGEFEAVVSRLNTTFAGRSLFAGEATDGAALAEAGAIFTTLEAAVSGEVTPAGIATALDAWFAVGGGFESFAFTGSTDALPPVQIGGGRAVDISILAADAAFRTTLKGLAMAAFAGTEILASNEDRAELVDMAGAVLHSGARTLMDTRAAIGSVEDMIEQARVEAEFERNAMELERNAILTIDLYERATELEQIESQIQMLYALTSRSANLNLVNFLR